MNEINEADELRRLVAAYDRPHAEGRAALLDAMDERDGVRVARAWASSEDVDRRYCAARLMHLLPDEAHLPHLVSLVSDPEQRVAAAARRALAGQRRTAQWHAAVEQLAIADDAELRHTAQEWLQAGR